MCTSGPPPTRDRMHWIRWNIAHPMTASTASHSIGEPAINAQTAMASTPTTSEMPPYRSPTSRRMASSSGTHAGRRQTMPELIDSCVAAARSFPD